MVSDMKAKRMNNLNNKVMTLWDRIETTMNNSPENYSKEDKRYLSRSITLVIVFFDEANKRRLAGIKDSAKKIIEDLRSESAVGDCSDKFKIDNTGTSLLAHIYNDYIKQEYFFTKNREPFGVKTA